MQYLWASLITVWLVVAVYFYISYVIFHKNFGKAGQKRKNNSVTGENNGDYERINISSADEIILTSKLYTPDGGDGETSVLLCHSFRSDGETDFQKEIGLYKKLGYNILVIEQRCHGKSSGDIISMGITESYDVVYWCKWLELRFGTGSSIVIHGKGMGAFAVLAGLANPELPQNVEKAVVEKVSDSVFADFQKSANEKYGFWSKMLIPTVNMFYRLNTGFDMRDADLKNFIKKIRVPVLFSPDSKQTNAFKNTKTAVSGIDLKKFLNE